MTFAFFYTAVPHLNPKNGQNWAGFGIQRSAAVAAKSVHIRG